MGYNISVAANNTEVTTECDRFLERTFYVWVVQFHDYGEQSCIIQTGKYFGLDLTPLTNVIYTRSACDEYGLQETDFLINLVSELIDNIHRDRLFIDKIKYEIYKGPSDLQRKIMIQLVGRQNSYSNYENLDPNPWRKYIVEGEFLEHLNILKESLECFKSKGCEKVFLTAS